MELSFGRFSEVFGVAAWVAGIWIPNGHAKPLYFGALQTAYPKSKSVEVLKCNVCHRVSDAKLNYYGLDFQKKVRGNGMGPFDFKTIEAIDSDADGPNNLAELNKGTHPGVKGK